MNPSTKVLAGAVLALALAVAMLPASAQQQTQRLRGTIASVDGNTLGLKASDGAELKLTLVGNAMIVAVVKASLADVKEGTFLGSAAMPQPDGSQKALEVHIFPEQMRGTGEGHRPYAPVANSTMTNGTAAGATVTGVDGPVEQHVVIGHVEMAVVVDPRRLDLHDRGHEGREEQRLKVDTVEHEASSFRRNCLAGQAKVASTWGRSPAIVSDSGWWPHA